MNVNTNRAAWRFDSSDRVRSTPFVANELVYFGADSGDLFAVDFGGSMKWRFQAKRAIISSRMREAG